MMPKNISIVIEKIITHITPIALIFAVLFAGTTAFAQTVYETRGANGPVFSDKPQAGAKAIELRPLNVIDNASLTGGSPAEKAGAPAAQPKSASDKAGKQKLAGENEMIAYRSFSIVFPENDGSVWANTAVFEVRVAVEPPLQLGEGHAFTVSISGKPVGQRFTATEFMIPPEFWGDQPPPPNQRMQLSATLVDRNGVVLKEAAPVQFQLRYATVLQRPHALKPQPKIEVKVLPETKPTPEPASKTLVR
jgi:hypothetical protein